MDIQLLKDVSLVIAIGSRVFDILQKTGIDVLKIFGVDEASFVTICLNHECLTASIKWLERVLLIGGLVVFLILEIYF